MKRKKIGEILVQENFLTPEQLDQALVEAKKEKKPIGRYPHPNGPDHRG